MAPEFKRSHAALALEGLAEGELVAEAEPGGDLLDREVAEAEQPRGLEQHAVKDELLGRLSRELREHARERPRRDAELGGVVAGLVARRQVALEQLLELLVEQEVRPARTALLELALAPALGPQERRGQQVPAELR